jgi:hypothetical protein
MERIRNGNAYRIRSLPQVLQDLIADYVHHRSLMFSVHREIMQADHATRMFSVHREIMQTMYHGPRMYMVLQELKQTVKRYGADRCDNCKDYVGNYGYTYTFTHTLFNETLIYCYALCMEDSVNRIQKTFGLT